LAMRRRRKRKGGLPEPRRKNKNKVVGSHAYCGATACYTSVG
jgi:hypothetical protein